MDYNILINGIIHQLFIQNTYMPDDDTLTILNKYFNNTSFTITAFRLTSDNDSDNYQRELSNLFLNTLKDTVLTLYGFTELRIITTFYFLIIIMILM